MNYTTLNEKITNALVENGYIVIENALDIALVDKLLKEVSDEALFERATISRNTVLDNNRRRDKISWLHDENSSHGEFLSFISSLQNYLNYAVHLHKSGQNGFNIYVNMQKVENDTLLFFFGILSCRCTTLFRFLKLCS